MNRVMESLDVDFRQESLAPQSKPQKSKSRVMKSIRVLLADDHPVVRWGLTCCLADRQEVAVIGEASDLLAELSQRWEKAIGQTANP